MGGSRGLKRKSSDENRMLTSDLVPALACAANAAEYDWCSLVLEKLMKGVVTFAHQFYSSGFAGGCGGCFIYAVVFYLDRLNRDPVKWGFFPRLKVWDMKQIGSASKEDRSPNGGDYGQVGTLDVAYGESHPREYQLMFDDVITYKPRPRRGQTNNALQSTKSDKGKAVYIMGVKIG